MPAQTFTILSDPGLLQPFLKGDLLRFLDQTSIAPKTRDSILVALGEAITNCIRHSYGGQPGQKIEITAEDRDTELRFRIRDYGKPADREKIEAKLNPVLPPETPGGLGVYFIKTLMDTMEYSSLITDGNELILTKKK